MEGYSIADLAWGTGSAKAVTLSFWAQSSQTGNYGGCIQQGTGGYNYLFSYNITSANTWQFFTIVIPGPTGGGTWTTNSNTGWTLWLDVGSGTSNQGTAYTWGNTGLAPTGSATILNATNTTLYWTGFQLEKGNIATPFEYLEYGHQLRMCQRYYCTGFSYPVIIAGSTTSIPVVKYPVEMRAGPSVSYTSGLYSWNPVSSNQPINSVSSIPSDAAGTSGTRFNTTTSGMSSVTAGMAGFTYQAVTGVGSFNFSAEL